LIAVFHVKPCGNIAQHVLSKPGTGSSSSNTSNVLSDQCLPHHSASGLSGIEKTEQGVDSFAQGVLVNPACPVHPKTVFFPQQEKQE